MSNQLSNLHKQLTFEASWHPSFEGKAIVDQTGKFIDVNPKFCEILGVTAGDLLDKRFSDITSVETRGIDLVNSKLVIEGRLPYYLLPKTYEFINKKSVDVVLLVAGVFDPTTGEFLHFLSRIVTDNSKLRGKNNYKALLSTLSKPKVRVGIITIIAGVVTAMFDKLMKILTS